MCGIGGVIGRSDPIAGETLITNLDHRGPDGSTLWMEASTTLVHTRLAIVDLTDTGSQPFFSRSGRYVLVYNGEIYNHLELESDTASTRPAVMARSCPSFGRSSARMPRCAAGDVRASRV